MAVVKDAVSNVTLTTGQASGLNIGLTIGASATFLVVGIEQDAATPGAPNWDSAGTNQLMTSLGTAVTNGTSSPTMTLALFGLVNPTPGAKLLKLNGSSNGTAYVSGMSVTGSETSSVAAAIEGYATNQGSAANATVSSGVAIPTGDMAVTFYNNIPGFTNAFTPGGNPGDGGTAVGKNEGGTTNMAAEYYSGAGATINSSAANASSAGFVAAIVGIKAPGGAAAPSLGWQARLSVAPTTIQAARSFSFVPFDTVQPSNSLPMQGWQQPLSRSSQPPVPVWPGFSFVPLNPVPAAVVALATGWQSPFGAAPQRQSVPYSQPQLILPPAPQIPFGWQLQLSVAPPIVRSPFGFSFVPLDTAQAQTPTTPPVWLSPLSIAPPIVKAPPGFAYVPFDTPQVVGQGATLGWQSPLSVAPVAARAPQNYFYVPFSTTQVIGLAWQPPLSIAPPRSASPSQSLAFVPFNTAQVQPAGIAGMPWQQPLSIAAPRPASASQSFAYVPFNTAQITPPPDTGRPHNLPFMVTVGRFRSF